MNRFDCMTGCTKNFLACYLPFEDPCIPDDMKSVFTECGVDIIELGMPCNDPYADGNVIASSMRRAYDNNPKLEGLPEYLQDLRDIAKEAAVVAMGYNSETPVAQLLTLIGGQLDGILLLGLPEGTPRGWKVNDHSVHNICFIPNSMPKESLDKAQDSCGYIMLQAVDGRTGTRSKIDDLTIKIKQVKKIQACTPLLAGFGISKPEHVRKFLDMGANGVVIGSKCVDLAVNEGMKPLEKFLKEIRHILNEG